MKMSVLSAISPCTCCSFHHFIFTLATITISFYYLKQYTKPLNGRNRCLYLIYTFLNLSFWLVFLFSSFICLLLMGLQMNSDLNQKLFSKFISQATSSGVSSIVTPRLPFDDIRCNLLNDLQGTVLEIGPGPGTNFKCFATKTNHIKKYIAIEINPYFKPMIDIEYHKYNLTFPVETIWLNLSASVSENNKKIKDTIRNDSIDNVIGTHVLCSIPNMDDVLSTIHRTLKMKGKYYFIEHILVSDQMSFMYLLQAFLSPLFQICGNGCQFKPMYELFTLMKNSHSVLNKFDILVEKFNAPLPLYAVVPHIKGVAVKIK